MQLRNELKKMQKDFGITTIYVTHDQEEALTLSDRIAVFNLGKVEQIGTPSEIYEHPASPFVAGFVGVSNIVEGELAKRITVPVQIEFMKCSSYGNETESSGVVKITQDLDEPIRGKNILVVEDIIDTGRTMHYLLEILRQRDPESVKLCALLDKPERRVTDVKVDYTGFVIPDEFIVGYGLDYAQKYRNLPYIGKIVPEGR